jgi:2',3'-cyclic-nucleotide 2'-phosphodiesterase (5'-nucleotidase family)
VAIMNNGGIRADLPAGNVTWGNLYEVQPFQNRLLKLTVTGAVLQDALEHCVAGRDHMPDCHVAGAEVWYDGHKEPGKRVNRIRLDNGKGIDKNGQYALVVSDFMATGGSGFGMLSSSARQDLDVIDLDALIRYLGVLRAPVEAPAGERFHRTDH